MKKIIITSIVVVSMVLFISIGWGRDECKNMEVKLQSLNLLNGLNLSKEQLEQLIPLIEEAETIREKHISKVENIKEARENSLIKLSSYLEKRETPPQEVALSVHKYNKQLKDEQHKFLSDMKSLVEKTRSILTEGQLYIISNFTPCLIPLRSSTNPALIGQVKDNTHLTKMLEKIRSMPEDEYEMKKPIFLARVKEKISQRFQLEGTALDEYMQKVEDTMTKARALSEEEFNIQEDLLIEGLYPSNPKTPIKRLSEKEKVDMYIGRFLLNPELKPVIEARIKNTNKIVKE